MRILVTFAVEAEFAPWRASRKFDRQKAPGLQLWKTVSGDSETQLGGLAVAQGAEPVDAFYTAKNVLTTAEQKLQLSTIADVVEMESFYVVKEGGARGARGVAIRAISDGADENLPIDFNCTMSSHNRVSIPRVLAEVAKRPGSLWPLIRFVKQTRRAGEAIARKSVV